MSRENKKKILSKRFFLSFHDYRRKGILRFALIKLAQLVGILTVIVIVIKVLDKYFIDFDLIFDEYFGNLNTWMVLAVFTLSESLLGLIPPDFFIIWADQRSFSVIFLTIIAFLSYIGGINSYFVGRLLIRIKFMRDFISRRYDKHSKLMVKWGNVFIALAAFFPIPYSPIGMLAGMMKFPVRSYFIYSLTRILRFYVHALVLFNLIN